MTITPGPTTASSVFSLAESDLRVPASSVEIDPKAPLMSTPCTASIAAARPGVTRLGLVEVMAEHPYRGWQASGIGGHAESAATSGSGDLLRQPWPMASGEGLAGRRMRVPGAGREYGEWGQSRPGLSCSTTRLPPAWCQAHCAPDIWHGQPGNSLAPAREAARPGKAGAGTSLVRALALHGVARHCARGT